MKMLLLLFGIRLQLMVLFIQDKSAGFYLDLVPFDAAHGQLWIILLSWAFLFNAALYFYSNTILRELWAALDLSRI